MPGMLHPWARAGSRRFPGDPSYAFALLQDPGRAGKTSPLAVLPTLPPAYPNRRPQRVHNLEANTGLQHPLSTLHERRRRLPCKTRFRLAGCASTGRGSNPLDRFERFQVTFPFSFPGLRPVARVVYAKKPFGEPHKGTRADGATAYGLFKQALALDPNLADAHLGLARALIVQWDFGSVEDFAPLVRQARESAPQAVALDSENPQAQYVLAQTSHWAGDVRAAIAHASRAIELNGNFALGHFYLGIGLSLDGRHEEALEAIETGWRLSPRDPRASTWLANKARVFHHLRRYEEAIGTALSARRIRPHAYGFLILVASYAQLGRDEEVRRALADIKVLPADSEKTTAGIWTATRTQ